MHFDRAAAIASQIQEELAAEVARARDERRLLRSLDAATLTERAEKRRDFNILVLHLERELQRCLSSLARELGLQGYGLTELAQVAPSETEHLAGIFAKIRSLASALSELDALNRSLAERTLNVVRSYLLAVVPRPAAYDRHGVIPTASQRTTLSTRV